MNPWQTAQQLKHLLTQALWPGGVSPAGSVFGPSGVKVFVGDPVSEEMPSAFPFALVNVGTGTSDTEDPDLIEQEFKVVTCALVYGDPIGEYAVIGGAAASLTKSAGRGVLEVATCARAAVEKLTGANGALVRVSAVRSGAPKNVEGRHVVMAEMTVSALCTSAPHYAEPQELVYGGTTFTWAGAQCSSRYDFIEYQITHTAGEDPLEAPGPIDYAGTAATANVFASVGSAYSVHAVYASRNSASPEAVTDGRLVGASILTPA